MNDDGATYVSFEHTNAVHARTVLVDWMLGNACSYACSYCPKSLHDGTVRWQNPDAIVDFYDQLQDHYVTHRDRRVWLQFTGGEPTMHPQIVRILEEASVRGFSVSLISNASRTHRFWTKIKPHLNAVILTYHSEFVDFGHFKGVGEILVPDVPMHINITMKPAEFGKIHVDALELRRAFPDATISLKPLRVDFATELYEYSDAQMAIMDAGLLGGSGHPDTLPRATMTGRTADDNRNRLRANEIILRNLNRFKGYRCNAGLESLRINASGQVFRATCGVGGSIGTLGEKFELPYAPISCTAHECGCTADILITKSRAEQFVRR
ncbi:radical SAM protein [uncultured Tateyamaria sp.]|uniref:radical SAM protein n=1 Tax=uncultured Tateyamaria sp. TaxID=455651 RepID=UPI002620F7C1|nr:radical SAM protein [uncultured Tateyamaria sp.]